MGKASKLGGVHVLRGIEAMTTTEQALWAYWKARALRALAPPGTEGEAQRGANARGAGRTGGVGRAFA